MYVETKNILNTYEKINSFYESNQKEIFDDKFNVIENNNIDENNSFESNDFIDSRHISLHLNNIQDIRTTKEYSDCKKEVFKRDGGVCKICGESSNIHMHHIHFVHKYRPELAVDPGNCILLCEKHHKEFHHFYGNKRGVAADLFDFMLKKLFSEDELPQTITLLRKKLLLESNKKTGEYNELLDDYLKLESKYNKLLLENNNLKDEFYSLKEEQNKKVRELKEEYGKEIYKLKEKIKNKKEYEEEIKNYKKLISDSKVEYELLKESSMDVIQDLKEQLDNKTNIMINVPEKDMVEYDFVRTGMFVEDKNGGDIGFSMENIIKIYENYSEWVKYDFEYYIICANNFEGYDVSLVNQILYNYQKGKFNKILLDYFIENAENISINKVNELSNKIIKQENQLKNYRKTVKQLKKDLKNSLEDNLDNYYKELEMENIKLKKDNNYLNDMLVNKTQEAYNLRKQLKGV